MIAAGTMPPRVTQTIACQVPCAGEPPGERAGVAMELVPGHREGLVGRVLPPFVLPMTMARSMARAQCSYR